MMVIDAHSDTLGKWAEGKKDTHFNENEIKGEYLGVMAAFPGEAKSLERITEQINLFHKIKGFHKVMRKEDLENKNPKKILLALEDSGCIDSLGMIDELYKRGVRIITLTWNYENNIASGCMASYDKGLTDFGRKAIRKMENLGITIDLSHIGEKSFYEVVDYAKKPVILSHSNLREVHDHKRNIKKEQFQKVIEKGGVVGVNFYPLFLSGEKALLSDVIRHIDGFLSLGGEDNIGIGTDFDGIDFLPSDVRGTGDIYTLISMLCHLYGEKVAKKIAGENFLRVLWQNLE